jgi:hypothetical protein
MALVNLIILVVVLALVCILAKWVVGYMGVPHPIDKVILTVVVLLCILALLNALGLGGGPIIRIGRAEAEVPGLAMGGDIRCVWERTR